jgi:plasmid maintenance system killer protein
MPNQASGVSDLSVSTVNKVEFLWKIIQRFDFYINSTNTKASAIIAFNIFVLGGIVLKASELLPAKQTYRFLAAVSSVSLLIAAIASLVSLGITFSVISPFLKSFKKQDRYTSNLFFIHVANLGDPIRLYQQIESADDEDVLKDLSVQAYSLAQGLNKKFNKMRIAFQAMIFFQFPAFGLAVLIKLFTLVF